jgi:DNA-binding CsgD family transcriptional regulator
MPLVSDLPAEAARWLEGARGVGFDKLIYSVDVLDGDIDPPLEVLSYGVSSSFWEFYLNGIREDALRRMVARGEITVGNTPVAFENDGTRLSIASDRRLSVGDTGLLRWFLSQGHRTGVSFRIRMTHGRHASLNFFSARDFLAEDLALAMQRLFLIGHHVHADLEPRLAKAPGRILSARESQCLEWIASGKSNREIATLLCLSVDTVKEHVQSLFQKLQVSGRAQAVAKGHALSYLG